MGGILARPVHRARLDNTRRARLAVDRVALAVVGPGAVVLARVAADAVRDEAGRPGCSTRSPAPAAAAGVEGCVRGPGGEQRPG